MEDNEVTKSGNVIGVVGDDDLEWTLIDAAIRILDGALSRVDYARKHSKDPPIQYPELPGVSISFDHRGASTKALDQRMSESGVPQASNLPGDGYWFLIRNESPRIIKFNTFSTYMGKPPSEWYPLGKGVRVPALDDGLEVSIVYGLLDKAGEGIRYTGVDFSWQSYLPPGRSVLFSVEQDHLKAAESLFVDFTDAEQPQSPTYRVIYHPNEP